LHELPIEKSQLPNSAAAAVAAAAMAAAVYQVATLHHSVPACVLRAASVDRLLGLMGIIEAV
jgi:hypothetical protein